MGVVSEPASPTDQDTDSEKSTEYLFAENHNLCYEVLIAGLRILLGRAGEDGEAI
jgi:hypothetical protein